MFLTYTDFMRSACRGFKAQLAGLLEASGLSKQDVEIYINYPGKTEKELAAHFSITEKAVKCALRRVRRTWPSLQNDPTMVGQYGSPELRHMQRIETSANSDDRLNESEIIKF